MTISNTYTPYTAIGNGTTTIFSSSSWGVLNSSHLKVALENIATGIQTIQTITTHYTLIFTTNSFSVTFITAPTSVNKVIIYRDVPETQDEPYKTTNGYPGQTLENSFDKLTQITQQVQVDADRAIKLPIGTILSTSINPVNFKGFALGFNSSTGALEPVSVGDGSSTSVIATNTTLSRSLANRFGEILNLKDFGAVGDYSTDDTVAVVAWIAACSTYNKIGYAPAGNYKLSNNLVLPQNFKAFGDGGAMLAAYPQFGGDKSKLRSGYKNTLTGTNFFFTGTPTNTVTLANRTDNFASMTPMLIYKHYWGLQLTGMTFIQDIDVYTSGGALTTSANDNRATGYTSGLYLLSTHSQVQNTCIFGLFPDNAVVINTSDVSPIDGEVFADADYNTFMQSIITSGVAIIGRENATTENTGLTGSRFTASSIQGADHHTRADSLTSVPVIYIDGDLTSTTNIRGHKFVNCSVRGITNTFIKLDHCTDFALNSCVVENPAQPSIPGADTIGKIIATSNTSNIALIDIAVNNNMGVDELFTAPSTYAGNINILKLGDGVYQGYMTAENGKGVFIRGNASTGDSDIQLTNDITSSTTGWVIKRDESVSNTLDLRFNNTSQATLSTSGLFTSKAIAYEDGGSKTIVSGVITVTNSYHSVSTEGGAGTDDLDTINGGTTGQILILRAQSSSNDVVCKDGTGNLRLAGDFTLTHAQDRITLQYDGTNWIELSRSDNAA